VPGLIGLANSYLALKRYDEAVATFKKVLEISPQFVPALNNLAWTYAEQGQNLGEALSLAQQARQLAPKHAGIADTTGWILLKRNMVGEAIATFREAVELAPRHPTLRYHLGLAYARRGRGQEAVQELQTALEIAPRFPEADEARQLLTRLRQ